MKTALWLPVGLLVVVCLLLYRANDLKNKLLVETAHHAQTQVALQAAVQEGQRWMSALQTALTGADAHKALAEACLAREAQGTAERLARAAVFVDNAPSVPLPPENPVQPTLKSQVVNDATRKRAAAYLNRPL